MRRRVVGFLALLLLVLAARSWVITPFEVVSDSMSPTLPVGSTIFVDRVSLHWTGVRAQDLVMIEGVEGSTVKRVVGLSGDRVEILDAVLHINGTPVLEPYVDSVTLDGVFFGPVEVPPGHVFVLGDNRFDSIDSRGFGPISEDLIEGRVIVQ
ncbi:MAG: signal peptidase I [Dermatophilaceae bacterium]|nr:signal peptidase I [Intrasporangiaceae bacterium]